ncbi:MAG: tRNA (N(6)-L-threonylcarbamoyladenosine(37)-C(2))-methylthiotransferase MtaB, partial [Rubrobacteridae bacterium]|nr:tRNA (N(6)-L-threonylcarbamoyladenosine(37)-C(2))-methylthiotransferase MtaB [Rubrobacteridae bacterium]
MNKEIKFAVHTLGCKVNQYESEKIIQNLEKSRWVRVSFSSFTADVHIINTCTVTAVANHKSRQLIRRAANGNPNGVVAVTGCYADLDRDEISAIEGVDLVIGNEDKNKLPELIESLAANRKLTARLATDRVSASESSNVKRDDSGNSPKRTRALVKVQDGCNNFCTYCIVP